MRFVFFSQHATEFEDVHALAFELLDDVGAVRWLGVPSEIIAHRRKERARSKDTRRGESKKKGTRRGTC
jgi:hypothetical protein